MVDDVIDEKGARFSDLECRFVRGLVCPLKRGVGFEGKCEKCRSMLEAQATREREEDVILEAVFGKGKEIMLPSEGASR